MEDIKKQVGQRIRDARKVQGLTQKELGEKIGVSKSVMSRYEHGEINFSIDALQKISTELGMSLEINIVND